MQQNYMKQLCCRVAATLLFVLSAVVAWAQDPQPDYTADNVNYFIDGSEAYVGASPNATGAVNILNQITVNAVNYPVTKIGSIAFASCHGMTSVSIPSNVTTIGISAFLDCNGLTSITIPDNVTTLEERAFDQCSNLLTATVGNGVEYIPSLLFQDCSSLTTVTLGNQVSGIEYNAFMNCDQLTSIRIASDNEYFTSIDGIVYSKDGKTLVKCPTGKSYVNIPIGVTTIDMRSFYDCETMTAVTVPSTVTTIKELAFNCCTNLKTVTIGSGVTSILGDAFYYCLALEDVYCYADPADLTWIENGPDDFMADYVTKIHVADKNAWESKFGSEVRATFVGDLAPTVTATSVNGDYWTTFYNSAANLKADDNTTVYKAAITNSSTVSLSEVADKVINAGEAVVLKSTAATIALTPQAAASTADYSDNQLKGVDVDTPANNDDYYFVLSNSQPTFGFYHFTGNTLGANKAFIKAGVAVTAREYLAIDVTTGVQELKNSSVEGTKSYYDLQGRRVAQPAKGLYIVNGKKMAVK